MKIWIVYYSDITVDGIIVGVYATRELAERGAEQYLNESKHLTKTVDIREYEVKTE